MARTLQDAVLLLDAMSGRKYSEECLQALRADKDCPLEGMRLGFAEKLSNFHPQVERVMKASLAVLEGLGAEIVSIDIETDEAVQRAEYQVMLYEFKDGLERYLAKYVAGATRTGDAGTEVSGKRRPWPLTLQTIIEFNLAHADKVMPYFGQEILVEAAAKGSPEESEYLEAIAACRSFEREKGISAYAARHRLDAIIAASNAPAWKTDHLLGDHYVGGNTSLAAIAGCPHITVPAGFAGELPLGLSIFGVPFSEKTLIRVGLAFEHATGARRPPKFVPSS